ncbi:MAG: DUF4129 domain-containing protein [Acidimicrobiia bacterium]|nr:DUF4129 domain-containing protein [Acidimicrobiia bacterium]
MALVAAVAFVGVRTARRRTTAERAERIATAEVSRDPSTLESAAVDAEEHGDLDAALRLRFRAGLLRLDAAGAIRFRPSITSGEVARQVRDDDFRHLAVDFDEVAYGGGRRPTGISTRPGNGGPACVGPPPLGPHDERIG